MPKCVEISGGYVIESVGQTFPACSQYALLEPTDFERLTYFADLAIALDPNGDVFFPLVTAMIVAHGVVAGLRLLVENMKIENRHI